MNTYEAMIIFQPELKEDEVKKNIKEYNERISTYGGKVTSEDYWGMRNFAYEMKKKVKGHYLVSKFELDTDKLSELSAWLNLQNDGVLRSLITVVNK